MLLANQTLFNAIAWFYCQAESGASVSQSGGLIFRRCLQQFRFVGRSSTQPQERLWAMSRLVKDKVDAIISQPFLSRTLLVATPTLYNRLSHRPRAIL
jgi:hypothetical protein